MSVLQERQLVSYANSTRWGLFFSEIEELKLKSRVKWVFDHKPSDWCSWIVPTANYIENLKLGPIPFSEIEWFEIDLEKTTHQGMLVDDHIVSNRKQVQNALEKSKLNSDTHETHVRVWGYK